VWLFTPFGFFSVVADRDKANQVIVRARVKGDLENLRTKYLPTLGPTVMLQMRDYPYRGFVSRDDLAAAMPKITQDITYTNFKNEVTKQQGDPRHDLYLRVWGVMKNAEEEIAKTKRTKYQTRFDWQVPVTNFKNEVTFDFESVESADPPSVTNRRYERSDSRGAFPRMIERGRADSASRALSPDFSAPTVSDLERQADKHRAANRTHAALDAAFEAGKLAAKEHRFKHPPARFTQDEKQAWYQGHEQQDANNQEAAKILDDRAKAEAFWKDTPVRGGNVFVENDLPDRRKRGKK